MSSVGEITISKRPVPILGVVILAVIFAFGLFLVGYDQGHLFSIIQGVEASYCANDQGKYWQYHDEIYTNWAGERTGWISKNSLNTFAEFVELDIEKFNSCLDEHKYRQKVLDLEQFGREIGIDATPSFFVFNDKKIIKITGNQPLEVFVKVLNEFTNTSA